MPTRHAAPLLAALLSPLHQFARADVEEICVNRPGECFVRRNGRFERHTIPLDFDELYDIAVLAAAHGNQDIGAERPLLAVDLPDGSRMQTVIPPCVPDGTVSLTIRRHGSSIVTLESLPRRYRMDGWNQWDKRREARQLRNARLLALYDAGDLIGFFSEAVRARCTMLLTGATGSGKTTMLKTLVSIIDPGERLITIENASELTITQPNHVRLLYSHGGQGTAKVTQKDLLEAYLRPDRGFVGELRDPEAAYTFVHEVGTGHPGSSTTIHGKDAAQAFRRLFNLVKGSEAGRSYDDATIVSLLEGTIDIIVPFQERRGEFAIGEVWLRPDAERRGKTVAELMED
jgi:type IV secretion system protein VirB11